ncbi:hypothetical protein [Xenorhabdus griffiniae]|uniref:Uncharacterized protein n=1 Tax=Xenorhabdus griffiniae TaxID=351672 RepID=A0ABY9XF81_9GAMM|nr:hypothetical protein [Xenorhabdus griffiniae]MBD1226676.1 hypothetical protein [Xenorhabdus griffiniae]MBE8586138.1 hypothetical protein [Xenorhabdus griffiniae]WMV71549.1 hypothetical protein QL128_15545 [Xenorhabdus griffiniae]WNH01226.1 hypothetical protein QL112_015550 [Xenorhabdus griffiniae]
MIKPELRPHEPVEPGYAILRIEDWQGATEGIKVSVQRNQDRCFVDERGQWISNEVWLMLPELQEVDGAVEAQIGPALVDALLAERQVAYRVTAKDCDGLQNIGVLKIADGVLSSLAKGDYVPTDKERELSDNVSSTQETAVLPDETSPVETQNTVLPKSEAQSLSFNEKDNIPSPVPPVSAKRSNKNLLIALAVLLIVVVAGAFWWWLKPQAKPEPVIASASETAPCAGENMTKGSGLDFVKSCLRSQPSSQQVLEIINQAKEAKQCDIAQRLYAYKAQSGDTNIALRYAQEYDPKTATKKGCFVADAQTAIYWYEILVNQDPQNRKAKARLEELKK